MWLRLIDSVVFPWIYLMLLLASVLGGYFIARKLYVARQKKWSPSGVESSVIGFFALVISFTLSSAYSSAHDRNVLIHEGGDAVAEMYRESFSVSPLSGLQARHYLLEHIGSLLSFYRNDETTVAGMTRTITMQNEKFYAAIMKDSAQKTEMAKLSPSYNLLSSATFRMLYSFEERTPLVIMWLLILSSWLIGLLVGFMNGFYQRIHLLVPLIYILLVAFTMKAIADLDNPLQGNIRPEYKNLEDLQAVIKSGFK